MDQHPILDACPLFAGLSPTDRTYALDYFAARRQRYAKGDFLNRITFPLPRFGLVLEGTVQVCRDDLDGHQMIMNNVGPGGTFGESYCFLGTDAPIYICAMQETEVLWLSTDRITIFQKPIEEDCDDEDEVRAVIGETLIHEVGHYFGMSEEEIEEIGGVDDI